MYKHRADFNHSYTKYRKLFFRFSCLALVFIYSACSATDVSALSSKQIQYLGSNIRYFNAGCGPTPGGTTTREQPGPKDGSVFILGDSIMQGAFYETDELKKAFDAKDITATVDAQGSRSIKDHKGVSVSPQSFNTVKTTGLEALEMDKDKPEFKNAANIVLELGTNRDGDGSAKTYRTNLKKLVDSVQQYNPSASIFIVNIFSKKISNRGSLNHVITEIAAGENLNVIDTTKKPIASEDNLHPKVTEGYKTYSKIIADALASTTNKGANVTVSGPFKGGKPSPGDNIKTGDAWKGKASSYGDSPADNYVDPGDVDSGGQSSKTRSARGFQ